MGIDSNMRLRSFGLKLILSYLFVILISLGLISFFLDKHLKENSLKNIKSSLIIQAELIGNQLVAENLQDEDLRYLEGLVKNLSPKTNCRITIINTQGRVVVDSEKSHEDVSKMQNHINRPEVKVALGGYVGSDVRYSPTLKMDMLYVAIPLKDKNAIVGVIRLAITLESVNKTLFVTRKIVILGFIFTVGFAFILGLILARRIISPINKMIQVSRDFSEGDFSRRIKQFSMDEIGELAVTLNKMAQDIENNIKEIKTQNQKLVAIFNTMIEGVIVVDKTGHIVSINRTVEKIFGISRCDAGGKLFLSVIRNNDISDIINTTFQTAKTVSCELSLVYPIRGIFEVNATAIFDNDVIDGCLLVIHDITEIRRLEVVHRDFVANVSHELKTPLTSIKGFVETLLDGALEDKQNNRDFLKIILEHTQRLNTLVDDLLSLSYLESKEIMLCKTRFHLREQVEQVISGFTSQLKMTNIEIRNDLCGKITIYADKSRIEQVFTNLIDNAIKFNKKSGVIRIYAQELDDKIKIFVEDSGVGIPQKDMPRIFERFYRVDKARSREMGGTGLGLSIVKHIIELHNGSVGVESTEGLGSKFWFILTK